ncbi:MAG: TIGR02679 domain-containing protein, partial [Jiangellaceae bacterium]
MSELPVWVSAAALAPVWTAIRRQLESRGPAWRGVVTVGSLDRDGRAALADLVGGDARRGLVRVDVGRLDADLATRGLDLLDVVARCTGSPLRDRPAERAEEQRRRSSIVAAARAGLGVAEGGAPGEWVESWLASLGSGRGVTSSDAALAGRVLRALVFDPGRQPVVARNDLAVRLSSSRDAHSLDP